MRSTTAIARAELRFQPLHLLLTAVAGWAHRGQVRTIAYLIEESGDLRQQLGSRRPLALVATIFTPDTILR
ncbi:MAG: hypothetical protein IPM29_27190 [Planctomycetes bacterium]|nr:hypothetical protein [Planctomycetota bacterium]